MALPQKETTAEASTDACIKQSYAAPTLNLLKLKTTKGADGKPLKIVQKIAAHDYTTFGMCLLQDENGEEVALIEKNHISKGAESVTQAILQKWLTSDAPTRTYQHLIECLRQSELSALAELIANTTGQGTVTASSDLQGCQIYIQLPNSNPQKTGSQTFVPMTQNLGPLTCYESYYRKLYTSMSHSHTSQHWTHLPRCEFIQLAMIGSEELRRGDREEEMVRLAQLGRIETILDHKTSIDLDNLFQPPHPRIILIEGAPGGGKSTLALHICHKWAQGASFLAQVDLVILAYLRDQAVQNATNLADILPARSERLSEMIASQIQDFNGENVLFIFDGWDEFPSHLQTNSLVSTIIRQPHKLSLHQSTVLITTRPVSSGNLLHIADRRVEILGFTKYQIREYIEKALDGNSTCVQKLVQHLEEHPVIEGYCYVPLHAAILVHIFLTMKGALPTTLHELFCDLVLCCIVRELDTHESDSDTSEVCSLDDLPDDLKSKLSDLCVLAYEGVMQNKVVFYRDDLQKFNFLANVPSLGLVQTVEGLTKLRKSLSHNFLHLSVQELLAAYHVSHIDSSKQRGVFERMFGSSRFQAVLQYYSGFTKLANPAIQDFISTYSEQQSSIEDLLPLLHCFYEAQEPYLCKLVASRFTKTIQLRKLLNPVDYSAIGYFITSLLSVSCNAPNVQLSLASIDDRDLNLLLLELSKYHIGVLPSSDALSTRLEVELLDANISDKGFKVLASCLRKLAALKLQRYNDHNSHHIEGESLEKNSHSDLQCNVNVGFKFVFQSLQHNTTLVHLDLFDVGWQATVDTAQELTTMLQVNKTLTHLDLSKNRKFSDSAYCVFQGLQDNTTLVHLNLSNIDLRGKDDTAQALTTMLCFNKTLTHLNLSVNWNFSDSGAYCVFQGLQHNTSLVHLNLNNIGLVATKDTAQALTTMLQVNKTIKHLDLSVNWKFSDAGAYCVCQGLQHNTSLVYLNLRCTRMTDEGAEYIAQALESNRSLQTLDILKNRITDNGFVCIENSLKSNTTLRLNK